MPELSLDLEVQPSTFPAKSGPAVPFQRPVLVLRNRGRAPTEHPELDLAAWEGETLLLEATRPLPGGADALPPSECAAWDLYDLLLESAPGFASKVHLFGVKAVLNWPFRVHAAARCSGATAASGEYGFRWEETDEGVVVRSG